MSASLAYGYGVVASVHTDAQTSITEHDADKAHLVNLLAAGGYYDLAANVGRCCTEFRGLGCAAGHVHNAVPTHRCRYRLCADCARERQKRAYGRLYPVLKGCQEAHRYDRPVLITLTIRSSHEPLAVLHSRFKEWFKRLRRSMKWKHCIRGAVAGFEFTWNAEKGWHYHCHILALRKAWYGQDELAEQWKSVTNGAGQIVDIQSKGDMGGMLKEVLKYCFKPAEVRNWTTVQVSDFNALRGARLSDTYGELRGFDVEHDGELEESEGGAESGLTIGSPCPDCGLPLDVVKNLSRSELRQPRDWLVRGRGGTAGGCAEVIH